MGDCLASVCPLCDHGALQQEDFGFNFLTLLSCAEKLSVGLLYKPLLTVW